MAKQKPGFIQLEGTFMGVTFVQSKKYKPHLRAARGTYKKAEVNAAFRDNCKKADVITQVASPIRRSLKEIDHGFAAADLWARMMRRMFRAGGLSEGELLQSLNGLELNEDYAFARLYGRAPALDVSVGKNCVGIDVEMFSHPRFAAGVDASTYVYEMHILFLDGKGSCVREVMETEWISFKEQPAVYEMKFEPVRGARYFLLVAGVRAGRGNVPVERLTGRGYAIVGWGKV